MSSKFKPGRRILLAATLAVALLLQSFGILGAPSAVSAEAVMQTSVDAPAAVGAGASASIGVNVTSSEDVSVPSSATATTTCI